MNMKRTTYLAIAALLFVSCIKEPENWVPVQVNFTAELPQALETRAGSDLSADKVYCAVFENDMEIPALRETISIENGQDIVYSPNLIKGRSYKIAFWACRQGCYEMTDMKKITRVETAGLKESDYDAFTQTVSVEVTGAKAHNVTLKRPFAQMNIGVTQRDWDVISDKTTYNMTPSRTVLKLTGKKTFNALQGKASGTDVELVYDLAADGSSLKCNNQTYKQIGSCFILAESEKQTADVELSVYDQNNSPIRQNVSIKNVPLQMNYKTNVVGELLTETVTYNITIDEAFNQAEHTQEIGK